MGTDFEWAGRIESVLPVYQPRGFGLAIDGVEHEAKLEPGRSPGEFVVEIDGRRERAFVATAGDLHFIHFRGRAHRIEAINALERARREAAPSGGDEVLRAPMPGVVVEVATEAGAQVETGTLLMTIESMKLQTAITAPHAAVVVEVCISAGASFDQGAALVRLEAETDADDNQDESAQGEDAR